jgi:putative flippase GtrA
LNTALDFILFNIFTHVIGISIFGVSPEVLAQIIDTIILVPFSYFLNKKFTFKSNKRKRETVLPFFVVSLFNGLILQTAIILLVTAVLGPLGLSSFWILANPVVFNNFAKVCSTACGMISNFTLYHFIFKEATPVSTYE